MIAYVPQNARQAATMLLVVCRRTRCAGPPSVSIGSGCWHACKRVDGVRVAAVRRRIRAIKRSWRSFVVRDWRIHRAMSGAAHPELELL